MERINDLLSRKFLFAVLATVLGFVLVLTDKVSAQDFLAFVGVIGAQYVLGNVVSKFVAPDSSSPEK
jgi:hypothetical protein